jgi:hypothetical protein
MVGTQITHLHKNMRFGVNGAYSNFNDKDEIQGGLIYHWYPFGNLNLYSMTELSILKYQSDLRTIINQKIGFKINTKLWAEMQLIYGDIQYSTVISDNFSYEIPNHTHALADANLIYLLNPSLNLVLGTQYLWKFSDQEESANNPVIETKTINYQQFNLIGGIQWKF